MEGLGINVPVLLAQIVNFAILLVVLYLFAYKPLLKMLDQRSSQIKESMEQAESIRLQVARTDEEMKARLETARKEGQALVAEATKIGDRLKEEARKEARKEAESLVARAKKEIERERDQAIDELRKEFANIVIEASEKVLKETLDKDKHRRMIEEVLKGSTFKKE